MEGGFESVVEGRRRGWRKWVKGGDEREGYQERVALDYIGVMVLGYLFAGCENVRLVWVLHCKARNRD